MRGDGIAAGFGKDSVPVVSVSRFDGEPGFSSGAELERESVPEGSAGRRGRQQGSRPRSMSYRVRARMA